jgi:hypothetical protein
LLFIWRKRKFVVLSFLILKSFSACLFWSYSSNLFTNFLTLYIYIFLLCPLDISLWPLTFDLCQIFVVLNQSYNQLSAHSLGYLSIG